MDSPYQSPCEQSPYEAPQASDAAPRGVVWVLQAAGAALAITAWGVLMLHVVLVVRAEHRLAAVLENAERFSQLPGVTETELVDYTQRQLGRQQFEDATLKLGVLPGARLAVEGVKAKPSGWLSRTTSSAARWFAGDTSVEAGATGSPRRSFFAK